MNDINTCVETIFCGNPSKIIISKPPKESEYRKICLLKKASGYQLEKYTEKQVFISFILFLPVVFKNYTMPQAHTSRQRNSAHGFYFRTHCFITSIFP